MRTEDLRHNGRAVTFKQLDFDELVATADSPVAPINEELRRSILARAKNPFSDRRAWYGDTDLDGMDKMMTEGWQEGMERALELKAEIEEIAPRPISVRRRLSWRDEGDELSHDRLYGGQIDSMWRVGHRQLQRSPRTLKILGEIGGSFSQTAEQLFWTGATLLALSDVLEEAGYSTDIDIAYCGNFDAGDLVYNVRLKEAGDPLRPDVVATGAAHSGAYRFYGFFLIHQCSWKVNDGHGHVGELSRHLDWLVEEGWMDRVDIHIHRVDSKASAVAELRRIVERVNEGMDA